MPQPRKESNRQWNHDQRGDCEHADEDGERSAAESSDCLDVRCGCHAGDDKGDNKRNHGHPDRVHPECSNWCDGIGGAEQRWIVSGRDGDAAGKAEPESQKNLRAFFHELPTS